MSDNESSKKSGKITLFDVKSRPVAKAGAPAPKPAAAPQRPHGHGLSLVKRLVVVSSAKGGVGKSTITAALAIEMAKAGLSTAVADLDVQGPSQHKLFGLSTTKPDAHPSGLLEPQLSHGVKVISLGNLVSERQAVVWRGPMVISAIGQICNEVIWGDVDILFLDTPPGTGDVLLTLGQKAPLDGAIIISTAQSLSVLDAIKGLRGFRKLKVPILGTIENLASFTCPNCGETSYPFDHSAVAAFARELGSPYLGAVAYDPNLATILDQMEGDSAKASNMGGTMGRILRSLKAADTEQNKKIDLASDRSGLDGIIEKIRAVLDI